MFIYIYTRATTSVVVEYAVLFAWLGLNYDVTLQSEDQRIFGFHRDSHWFNIPHICWYHLLPFPPNSVGGWFSICCGYLGWFELTKRFFVVEGWDWDHQPDSDHQLNLSEKPTPFEHTNLHSMWELNLWNPKFEVWTWNQSRFDWVTLVYQSASAPAATGNLRMPCMRWFTVLQTWMPKMSKAPIQCGSAHTKCKAWGSADSQQELVGSCRHPL